MARSDNVVGEVAQYGILAFVTYAGYGLALNGHFGLAAQQSAQAVHNWLKTQGIAPKSGSPSQPKQPSGQTPTQTTQPSNPAPSAPSGGHSTALSVMAYNNHNFLSQAVGWRNLRSQRGEDPNDWDEFRHYQIDIGAPDPGPNAPPEWPNDSSLGGPMVYFPYSPIQPEP